MFAKGFNIVLNEKNLTAYRVAKETGISQGLMNEYKSGKKIPTVQNLVKIADFLNCSIDVLVGRETMEGGVRVFKEKLRAERTKKNISQSAFAAKLFISQQAYAKYELGKASPNPEVLAKIADVLGVSVDYLLGRETSELSKKERELIKAYRNASDEVHEIIDGILNVDG